MHTLPTQLLIKLLTQNGGFSYNPNTNQLNPTKGFFVSLSQSELVVSTDIFNPQILINFVNTNKSKLEQNPNLFIGGWIDDNKVYLDLSEQIASKSQAIRKGLLRDQLAIYDAENQISITLPQRQKCGTEYQKETYIQQTIKKLL